MGDGLGHHRPDSPEGVLEWGEKPGVLPYLLSLLQMLTWVGVTENSSLPQEFCRTSNKCARTHTRLSNDTAPQFNLLNKVATTSYQHEFFYVS